MLDDAVHAQRCLAQLRSKDKGIEKYIYLSQLKDADPNMFYRLCLANMAVSARCPCARALLAFARLAVSSRAVPQLVPRVAIAWGYLRDLWLALLT